MAACNGNVLDRHEIGVGAVGALRGELQHLRPERGQHQRHGISSNGRRVLGGVHRVEVRGHLRDRIGVIAAARLDAGGVAYADAQYEPVGISLAERFGAIGHGHGVTGVDVGDAGGEDGFRRIGKEQPGVSENVLAAQALRNPRRREVEALELAGGIDLFFGSHTLERKAPHADRTEEVGEAPAAESAQTVHATDDRTVSVR